MSTYVLSDIHGEYDKFMKMLDKIGLTDEDTLYVLGDVFDRGPHPIKTLKKIMEMPNVIPVLGNHELMALECLDFLCQEITDETIENMSAEMFDNIVNWDYNGSRTTIAEFNMENDEMKREIVDFIKEFNVYDEVTVTTTDGIDKTFLLVHAGLGNYSPDKEMEDYSLYELVWMRSDYNVTYYPDRENFYVISGHTPTQLIESNPRPGYIYRECNQISIDCGAHFKGGRLAAICLETGEEFYSSTT